MLVRPFTNDTGIIHAFKDLNRFNERYKQK